MLIAGDAGVCAAGLDIPDDAGVKPTHHAVHAARRQPTQPVGEGAGQPGDFGQLGRQTGSGMGDHPATVGRDDKSRT